MGHGAVLIWHCIYLLKHLATKIKVFNKGNHSRDFTYIDDIIKGIHLCINKIPKK